MNITPEILFSQMEAPYLLMREQIGRKGLPIRCIKIWESGCKPEPGILYLGDSRHLPDQGIKMNDSFLLLCSPCGADTLLRFSAAAAAVLEKPAERQELQIYLLELCNKLRQWDAGISDAIFCRSDPSLIMSMGYKVLRYEYSIIDLDMVKLYSTPFYGSSGDKKNRERLAPDVVQRLMMQPDFHAVAKKKTSFYYYEEVRESYVLCKNLFLDDQYYARIVLYMEKEKKEVHDGIRELLEVFGTHMERLIKYLLAPELSHQGDQLHYLFRSAVSGDIPDYAYCCSVLKRSGWQKNDVYVVIKLRFYEDRGWDSQLDTALPYLVRELEGEWPGSCAIIFDASILWLVNTSVSGGRSGWEKLRQKAAFFVRDHVCHAGVSPLFRDYFMIPDSVRTADAALAIGLRKHPEFWYYLFDDYRLDYMMEKISSGISPAFLRHPAIKILEDWDREKGTELSATLEAYLGNNLNMTAAAEKLYIHRTTFCRRMNQIRRLTGLNMSDRDTVLTLLLSYRMLSDYSADGEDGRK